VGVQRSLAGLLSFGATPSFLLASLAMHRRELRADSPTVVFDLLAFDPNGTLRVLAETSEPKGEIGGLDSHAGLKDATLRATRESRRCIESGTPRAGPEAKADIAENRRNGAVQLRVDAEIRHDDAGDENAELFGKPSGKRRTVIAEQEALRGIKRDANAEAERARGRGGRPPRGGWRAERLGA